MKKKKTTQVGFGSEVIARWKHPHIVLVAGLRRDGRFICAGWNNAGWPVNFSNEGVTIDQANEATRGWGFIRLDLESMAGEA